MTTLAGIERNACPPWIGITGRLQSELPSAIVGIRTLAAAAASAVGGGHGGGLRADVSADVDRAKPGLAAGRGVVRRDRQRLERSVSGGGDARGRARRR